MEFHPDMGYVENDIDFTDVDLYKPANLPFGQATVLPLFSYQSKIFKDLEDEKLWTRNWIAIGSSKEIPSPGDMLPYTVGHHGIHVQREIDGCLIGRFNKAQHGGCRAVPLQCQTGKKTKCSFTSCGYSRDRQVIRVEEIGENTPTMHQYLGLIPERLLPVKVETIGSLIFINLDQEANDLSESYKELPDRIKLCLSNKYTLENSEWLECKANWKLAGRSFFDGQVILDQGKKHHDENLSSDFFLTSALSTHDIGVKTSEDIENIEVCWLFPNLVLIIHPSFIVSAIIQPTSMGECTIRTAIYKNEDTNIENDIAPLPSEWKDYILMICSNAQSMQEKTDELTAPGAPKITADKTPIENNIAGHAFHQYVFKQIETEYDYYWNTPLYSNNIRR
ncbi:MAG: ring-hydroxylating oxygenase subunit alpha [Gammaproteobacteria bacterium]